jgi:hypothetical protein
MSILRVAQPLDIVAMLTVLHDQLPRAGVGAGVCDGRQTVSLSTR